ncbi:DedA family protein [Paenibacillus donghaensis]|uniref:DedA family protein n=1 Tax=Paenibacillus donghaensis TaxID=414771 RepID=UPI001883A3F0|nr:DedA family protein [Paenibacillus donghaensis]MBE9917055.1 DedA family protein [Paenibacillus donghaensis]
MVMAVDFISQYGYLAVVLLMGLGIVGLPVPDETMMIFLGYLSSMKILNYAFSIVFSFIGSILGMTVSYLIGNKIGYAIIEKYGKWIGLTPKRYEKVKAWFSKYGIWTLLFSYFIPGIRHAAGYISGISSMPFKKYLLICCTGAVIWTILFISIGYFVGEHFISSFKINL